MDFERFGMRVEDLKYAWRMCRKARRRGKFRPVGSYEMTSNTDTGYFYRVGNYVYIVIDGSDNFLEWIRNFLWIRWGKDKVALGFLVAAIEMAEQAEKLLYHDDIVVGIGHSRGGAVVQKLALEIQRKKFCVESVISFGAPKAGGRKFCEEMKSHGMFHVRVVAPSDPVSGLPKIRGKHYESVRVEFEKTFDIFDLHPFSKVAKGVLEHLSYGSLLNSEKIRWK